MFIFSICEKIELFLNTFNIINNENIITILICLVVLIYLKYYNDYKEDEYVIYDSYYNLKLDDFNNKYPVLIDEQVENGVVIIEKFFKNNYSNTENEQVLKDNIYKCLSKYCIIHNNKNENIKLKLISPKYKDYLFKKSDFSNYKYIHGLNEENLDNISENRFVELILGPNQVIVIPTFWSFQSSRT